MRRLAPLLLVSTLVVSLAACSATSSERIAAAVGGEELTQSDLDDMLQSSLAGQLLGVAIVDGQAPTSGARDVAATWATLQAVVEVTGFESHDAAATDAVLAERYGADWVAAPQSLKDLLILNEDIGTAANTGEIDGATAVADAREIDVTVDARLGTWDSENFAITPLGS
jgi:hypothetical protein